MLSLKQATSRVTTSYDQTHDYAFKTKEKLMVIKLAKLNFRPKCLAHISIPLR